MKALAWLGIPVAALAWYLAAGHAHQRAMAPFLIAEPRPALAAADVAADEPPDAAFDAAGWKPVTPIQAEAFAYLDSDRHCNVAWRDAVAARPSDARIESAEAPGRTGLVAWHRMRIVAAGGQPIAMLARPGPRLSGQASE